MGADGLIAGGADVHDDTAESARSASSSAGGMTTRPSLRNCQAATCSPSRRSAISHRMVASDPVTERFGPRSTPIRIAPVTCAGTCAAWLTVAAISPAGRLLTRFDAKATTTPAIHDVIWGDAVAASLRVS